MQVGYIDIPLSYYLSLHQFACRNSAVNNPLLSTVGFTKKFQMSLGVIILVAAFPFGLALLLYCYRRKDSFKCEKRANKSKCELMLTQKVDLCMHLTHVCRCTTAVSNTLLYIGVISSVIIFPIGVFIVILCCFHDRNKGNVRYIIRRESAYINFVSILSTAEVVLISVGIAGSVIVLPLGLCLLFASFCCCCEAESDSQPVSPCKMTIIKQ